MLRARDGSIKVDGSGSAVRSDSSAGTVAEETVAMAGEMTIQLLQVSGSTTEATMRTHRVLIDRPTEKGGADAGPMGGEFFLASIGGCFMSNLLAAIRARDLEITGVRTEVIATLADSPTRFESVELRVTADTPDR